MPRVIGIDPGTISIDICGLDNGSLWLDRTLPTREALDDPESFLALLSQGGRPDLIAGPSGYGLPLIGADQATDREIRLALLAAEGEAGGLGGLGRLLKTLARSNLPVVFTPGVIHLPTVPTHRKLNRVDLGTADKLAAAALGVWDQARRLRIPVEATSFILLELGGAFTALVTVEGGAIIDGLGGTSGPMGWSSSGAWDGEVAFLAGQVTKDLLFRGGRSDIGEDAAATYIEGAHKAVLAQTASLPRPREILFSGRHAQDPGLRTMLIPRLETVAPVVDLEGFAKVSKQGAQGAALIADGLAGGAERPLVETLRLAEARGSVLDYLQVISPDQARRRIGIE